LALLAVCMAGNASHAGRTGGAGPVTPASRGQGLTCSGPPLGDEPLASDRFPESAGHVRKGTGYRAAAPGTGILRPCGRIGTREQREVRDGVVVGDGAPEDHDQ
ncbi:hypothetical protein ACWGDT_42170, partial [Streptomyces avermitilis]